MGERGGENTGAKGGIEGECKRRRRGRGRGKEKDERGR